MQKEATPSQHIVCYTSSSQKPEVSGWPGDGARATILSYQSNCGKVEDCLDHAQPVDVSKVLRTCHCQQEIQDCYTRIMYASSFGCFAHSSHWTALCGRSDENWLPLRAPARPLYSEHSRLPSMKLIQSIFTHCCGQIPATTAKSSIWSSMPSCYL